MQMSVQTAPAWEAADAASERLALITSGAYSNQELAAEFGRLPPAFLPVGNQRLYEYQRKLFDPATEVYLTLPSDFVVPPDDIERLAALAITVLPVPADLSLGESVVYALNLIGGPDREVQILHGDTLLDGIPESIQGSSEIAIGHGAEGYSWAEATCDGEVITHLETVAAGVASETTAPVACGYFSFAHSSALIRAITRAGGDFIGGICGYGKEHVVHKRDVGAWFDFGHVQTYFRSRRLVTGARAFNRLSIDGRVARKSSDDVGKMRAEASWFASIPPNVRLFSARLLDHGDDQVGVYYETEYEYLPTLAELYVFGALVRSSWIRMLNSCQEFLEVCARTTDQEGSGDDDLAALVVEKTRARLLQFAAASGYNVDSMLRYGGRPMPSLLQIADDIARHHINLSSGRRRTVMHGDFCFSNILYDSRIQRVHVIDPRGCIHPGKNTIFGDLRYDLAKLAHSIVGRYDQIIAGRYRLDGVAGRRYEIRFEQAPHHAWLEDAFNKIRVDGVEAGGREIRAVMIALFLSMLPLHADRPDRQEAFVANALRLYADLESPPL
jgi:hypothetical protein